MFTENKHRDSKAGSKFMFVMKSSLQTNVSQNTAKLGELPARAVHHTELPRLIPFPNNSIYSLHTACTEMADNC